MTGQEFAFMTAGELGDLYRSGEVSPVEVVDSLLTRIREVDSKLNSFLLVLGDQARVAAQAAEGDLLRGDWRGPLHGIPVGLKDLIDVSGVPTTFGSKVFADNMVHMDATVVQKLKAAGAIILGKHNMHEIAFGPTNENPHFGPVHNPWDLSRVPGGSSGGTAAAVAAGLGVGGLGSDTGGSIRIPSAFCGTVGLKPTYGRVSRRGAMPLSWSMDTIGPITRTVADCALVLQTISGPDPMDPSTEERPLPDFSADLRRGVKGLKLGLPKTYYFDIMEPGVAAVIWTAIEALQQMGATIVECHTPSAVHSQDVFMLLACSEAASVHEPWFKTRASEYGEDVRNRVQLGTVILASQYIRAQRVRTMIQEEYHAALRDVDAIVTPAEPIIAPAIGRSGDVNPHIGCSSRSVTNRLTCAVNIAGLPAVSVPCGRSEGMPVGLQVIGRAWDEAMILRIAAAVEEVTDWRAESVMEVLGMSPEMGTRPLS